MGGCGRTAAHAPSHIACAHAALRCSYLTADVAEKEKLQVRVGCACCLCTRGLGGCPLGQASASQAPLRTRTAGGGGGGGFRQMLRAGEDIPEWFAFKSVVGVLREHQAKQ